MREVILITSICELIHKVLVIMVETGTTAADEDFNIIENLLVKEDVTEHIDNEKHSVVEEVQNNVCMKTVSINGALYGDFEVTFRGGSHVSET